MAPKATDVSARHPASSIQIEERLAGRHIEYRFEPNLPIDTIVEAEGHQVRLSENRAPAEMVTRYAQQMKAGAVFPAIVVNERSELIDGNTRKRAALKAGRPAIAAYVCQGLTALQARSLSVELNQANGLPMDEAEVHAFVRSALQEGQILDTKTCARMSGIAPKTLDRWKAQSLFELRARRCGIGDADVALLSESVQAALNGIRLTAVLIEATSLALKARMSASAVRKLVGRINAASSEAESLGVVAAEREARADEIRSIANGFRARKRVGHRATMHVAALLRMRVDDLIEVAPEKLTETVARLSDLRDHIDRALSSAGAPRGFSPSPAASPAAHPVPELCSEGAIGG
jgi:hypothetical protein